LNFQLDDFQIDALKYIESGYNVLVGAPTGAGKTVVGDAGIFHWMRQDSLARVFYTTPIKALSNQKFHELEDRYGRDNVGLVTGDTVIRGDARIVVMTTEVLRNQVYSKSSSLNDLKCVVLDEVHFLGDKTRGSVWEEVLIHLPQSVNIIALSATVSNIEEFSAWLNQVRGNCQTVLTEKRPIPLVQHVILGQDDKNAQLYEVYTENNALNQQLYNKMMKPMESNRHFSKHRRSGGKGRSFPNADKRKGLRKKPTRVAIVKELRAQNMLPAIYFIFSRAGCDEAVEQIRRSGIQLTTPEQRDEISYVVDTYIAGRVDLDDLQYMEFDNLRNAWMSGIAAHHAGLLPLFKEIVEHLFERGLLRIVFATETLALGINMPARSVVIERLKKYDGVTHSRLTPGEFTQLTGRAGRRGLDTIGHSIVVDDSGLTLPDVATLSSRRVYPLKSAFTPQYNMAVNIASNWNQEYAQEVLTKSFAQFQLNKSSEDVEKRIDQYTAILRGYDKELNSHQAKNLSLTRNRQNKVKARLRDAQKQLDRNNTLIVNKYARIVEILQKFHYLEAADTQYLATERGILLKNFYCEHVLIFVECLYRGLFNQLSPAELTTVLSCFISLSRSAHNSDFDAKHLSHRFSQVVMSTMSEMVEFYDSVSRIERHYNINVDSVGMNFKMLDIAYAWGSGAQLGELVDKLGDINIGDLVRMSRGVLELLSQLTRFAGDYIPTNTYAALEVLQASAIVALFDS
jgi:ATP-dependent RNA helicase HelY